MYFKRKLLPILLAVGLFSCVSAIYFPNQKDAVIQNISLEKLQQGRELYVRNCGSCHNLYLPSTYTSREWNSILDKMQKPARIDDAQKALIAAYLNTNCKN